MTAVTNPFIYLVLASIDKVSLLCKSMGTEIPARSERSPCTDSDLSDPDVWLESPPYAEFERLRKVAPVAWNERHDGHKGFWAVTRLDDIVTVSRNTEVFSSREGAISLDDFDDAQSDARRTLLEMDPPQHTAMRRVTAREFTPKAIFAFEAFVRETAGRLIDEVVARGEVEIVSTFSKQLPILTLCRLLGVADDRREDMIRWSDALIGSDDPTYVDPLVEAIPIEERRMMQFGHPASLDAFELGRTLRAARTSEPLDDVVTALALGEVDGVPLNDQEFCNYFLMLVVAGNETTRHTLSHAIAAIAENPAEWQRFVDGDIDGNVAADECLRWASAVHYVRRVATADFELNGARIQQGDKVAMYYASANRDEEHFENAASFIIDRSPNDHVAFGRGGPHFCLGAHVARLQLKVFVEELAKRVRSIESSGRPERLRSNHINGIKSLSVKFIEK